MSVDFSLYVYIWSEVEHLYRHLSTATISYSVNSSFPLSIFSIGLLVLFFSFSLLFLKNILFIWLGQVLVEGREVFDLYYSVWTLSCGMWDLIDNQGSNPGPLHWELGVLATGPPGKSSVIFFLGNILGTLYILGILVLCDMLQTFFQCIIFLLTFLCGIFW